MGIDFTGGSLFMVLLLFAAGLLCIIKGGDLFVDAASWIAEASGIPKFIIGATVVSFATTMPEMLVSVFAALQGNADIAVGNAVGSVTANVGLIMCVALICMECAMTRRQFGVKACLLLAAILLLMHPAAAACLVTGEAYGVGAAAAIVMEAESGEVLFAQEIHRQLPMASTTKIMTALLTLEQPNLQQEFTVDETAIRVEGSSMGLRQGDTVTLYALAVGMLLASGNDAAGAAAVRISGSMKAFVAEMNRRAASLGMNNTHFVTPSGLDAEEHYSTAYDMALLARAALQNPLFAGIAASRRMTVSYGQPPYARSLLNHNRLLSLYGDAIGVKTGFTKKAGRCLVSAAEKDGVRLICVTLNCPDDWNTHAALYQRYFALTESRPLTLEAPILPVVGGQKAALQTVLVGQPTYTAIRGREEGITVTVYLNRGFCYAPVEAGQPLGQVVWRRGDHVIGTAVLAAGESIPALESHRPWWQKLYG